MDIFIAVLEGFHGSFSPVAHQTTGTFTFLQLAHFTNELVNVIVDRVNGWLEVIAALVDRDVALRTC